MIEAILYAASLSGAAQPHSKVSMNASGPAAAWEIAGIRIPPSISKTGKTQIQWRWHLLLLWWLWLAGYAYTGSDFLVAKHYPNCVPLLHMLSYSQALTHRQETMQLPSYQHELHRYHQIHCKKSRTEIIQKSFQSWRISFAIQVWYIRASDILHA